LITVQIPLKIEIKYINDLKNAINRKLDYYLLKYDDELNGVIISYQDIELLNEISNVSYNPDDTHLTCFIQATLLLFCPLPNSILTGTVNHVCVLFFYHQD
jgi:DNA-directed RNA polymerase I subunit RPA43